MALNVTETQILYDSGDKTVVKVVGAYNSAINSNTVIVAANTLMYANSTKPCVMSIISVQYAAGLANGYCSLQWVAGGAASNNDILYMGGKTSSQFVTYIPNPLAANTANINGGLSGDVGLQIIGAEPFDSFSLIITLIKEGGAGGGFAKAYTAYNDNNFHA